MRKGGLTSWREAKEIQLITYFALFYLIFFGTIALLNRDFEFLFYLIINFITLLFIVQYNKKMHMPVLLLFSFSLIGIFHIVGTMEFAAGRLYDLYLINGVLRFGNFVHFYSMFITTFVMYNIINPHLDIYLRYNPHFLSFILIMTTISIGAFSEVIEFQSVILFDAAHTVVNHFNNVIDLLYNFIASVFACIIILQYQSKLKKKEMYLM